MKLMLGVRELLLRVEVMPQRPTDYSNLYLDPHYVGRAERKMKRMKNEIKKRSICEIMRVPEFPRIVRNNGEVYPDDGGRKFINVLVACHEVLNP